MSELNMECSRCRVATTCPRNGSSPHVMRSGKKVLCKIIGGYGRQPVDANILSEDSAARTKKDGPCLTLAEVPTIDSDSGHFHMQLTKIFHLPVLHEREKTSIMQDALYPKSHN